MNQILNEKWYTDKHWEKMTFFFLSCHYGHIFRTSLGTWGQLTEFGQLKDSEQMFLLIKGLFSNEVLRSIYKWYINLYFPKSPYQQSFKLAFQGMDPVFTDLCGSLLQHTSLHYNPYASAS